MFQLHRIGLKYHSVRMLSTQDHLSKSQTESLLRYTILLMIFLSMVPSTIYYYYYYCYYHSRYRRTS